ncbi:MAG: iron-containing redox enzyme family protein [Acidimicrobiales bacterium]
MFDRPPPPPAPRGPLSAALFRRLAGEPGPLGPVPRPVDDPLTGDDTHVTLYTVYELHYRGLAGVDDGWEWHPDLVRLTADLEGRYEAALRADVGLLPVVTPATMATSLRQLLDAADGPSLSRFLESQGTLDQLREFTIHRSAYQRKEADPHTWALPRLSGRAKAAIIEIQSDEYGNGRLGEAHADLFADTMVALDLDPTYGAYVDDLPGVTLATVNLVTFLGLHRRLRGALVGHLAAFEMTSVGPMGRYARALRRLGRGGHEFYDVHVEADAHHEVVAAHELAGGLASAEPGLVGEILFGAMAVTNAERRLADHLLASWTAGHRSLHRAAPLPTAALAG